MYPGVAQLGARLTGGQEAVSSSLATRTTTTSLKAWRYRVEPLVFGKLVSAFVNEQIVGTVNCEFIAGHLNRCPVF